MSPNFTWVGAAAAQQGGDAGRQLGAGDRLDDVVVGPFAEGGQDGRLVLPGGEHQDGQVGHAAHHAQQVDAVQVGQAEVKDQGVGLVGGQRTEAVEAVGLAGGAVAVAGQVLADQLADALVVLDHQDVGHLPSGGCCDPFPPTILAG